MTDYKFTMLTFSQPITTKTTGGEAQAPWSNVSPASGVINMSGATLSTITLSDDDTRFQSGRYTPDTIGQSLTAAVTFGNSTTPTPAGTQLSFHIASVL